MDTVSPLPESTVARIVRQAYAGAKWSVLQQCWLVSSDALLQKEFESRRLKGLPPLWGDVPGRVHE